MFNLIRAIATSSLVFFVTTTSLYAGTLYNTWWACIGKGSDICSVLKDFLHTYDDSFSLSGKIIPGTISISISHNDDTEYFLKKFNPNSVLFYYNVSRKFWNLVDGKNLYHVRFYDINKKLLWKEYIYEVMFFDRKNFSNFNIKKWIKPSTEEDYGEENLLFSQYYYSPDTANMRIFRLTKNFWNYLLDLWNGYTFVYTTYLNNINSTKDPWNAKFKITYKKPWTTKTISSNEIPWIDFSAYMFNNPSITKYTNDYYIIETWAWHEGVSTVFAFSPKKMKFYNLYELEKKIIGNDAYPVFSATIKNGQAIITEFKYCCDTIDNPGWYEKIVLDLENEKLVSREVLKK